MANIKSFFHTAKVMTIPPLFFFEKAELKNDYLIQTTCNAIQVVKTLTNAPEGFYIQGIGL
jgi:hypothetical protein